MIHSGSDRSQSGCVETLEYITYLVWLARPWVGEPGLPPRRASFLGNSPLFFECGRHVSMAIVNSFSRIIFHRVKKLKAFRPLQDRDFERHRPPMVPDMSESR